MKVLLVDNGTTLLRKLCELIPGAETVDLAERFSVSEGNNYDLVILSGSSKEQLVGNESDFKNEIAFIKSSRRPIIGICFGCELIVSAFDGTLRELATPSKGIKEISIVRPGLFDGKTLVSVFENHRWAISALPEHFELLAKSADGPEIIRHKSLPIYGFQFHPENFVDTTEGDWLFLSLFSRLTKNI